MKEHIRKILKEFDGEGFDWARDDSFIGDAKLIKQVFDNLKSGLIIKNFSFELDLNTLEIHSVYRGKKKTVKTITKLSMDNKGLFLGEMPVFKINKDGSTDYILTLTTAPMEKSMEKQNYTYEEALESFFDSFFLLYINN